MELEQLWQAVLAEMELQVPRPTFITWIKNTRLIDQKDGIAIVAVPNDFAKNWLHDNYHKQIFGLLREKENIIKGVQIIVQPSRSLLLPVKDNTPKTAPANQLAFEELKIDPETNLNPRYTLNSFAVGNANELAHAAACAVIENVGIKYNPLFIYGGVGVGKTHLIQAIGNEVKKKYESKVKVRYVSSEKFTNDVISGIRNKRMEDMKNRYRNVDVLIIDDIQFLAGKASTQQEFFNTFNALYEQNKQIIISSDRAPNYLPILEERLKSRLQCGMIADIANPDYELRVAVLKTKLEEKNSKLPDAIIEFIATRVQKNLRDLEGLLNRIIFLQQERKADINEKIIEQLISETVNQPLKNTNPTLIIRSVADHYQVSVADLVGKSRKKELIDPRQVAIYLLRDILDMSFPAIGEKLGKRDHTTAIYAYKKIEKEVAKNKELGQKILVIKDQVEKNS